MYSALIDQLIEKFERLPGIGHKSAERIAFYILEKMDSDDAQARAETIVKAKKSVRLCKCCQNLTDDELCNICSSPKRDKKVICVVEGPEDVSAIENTHEYNGLYHVLHGALSPMDGIGPDDVKINELLLRLAEGEGEEIILATNPPVNGTATAVYISKLIKPTGIKVSRIASGVPVGGDLEYIDEITLLRALEGRTEL